MKILKLFFTSLLILISNNFIFADHTLQQESSQAKSSQSLKVRISLTKKQKAKNNFDQEKLLEVSKKTAAGLAFGSMAAGSIYMLKYINISKFTEKVQGDKLLKTILSSGHIYFLANLVYEKIINKKQELNNYETNKQTITIPDRLFGLSKSIGGIGLIATSLLSGFLSYIDPDTQRDIGETNLTKYCYISSLFSLAHNIYDLVPKTYRNLKLAFSVNRKPVKLKQD